MRRERFAAGQLVEAVEVDRSGAGGATRTRRWVAPDFVTPVEDRAATPLEAATLDASDVATRNERRSTIMRQQFAVVRAAGLGTGTFATAAARDAAIRAACRLLAALVAREFDDLATDD